MVRRRRCLAPHHRQTRLNVEYLALCRHLGLEPCTINPASPHENGDIESAHGHLKRRLATHLALRGSREFADEAAFARFVAEVCIAANALRSVKVAEERARLTPLPATRYPEWDEVRVRVCSHSTVRVRHCAYSVPAKLIGAMVQAQITEAEVIVRHEGLEVARYPRTIGRQARIDYRHVVASRPPSACCCGAAACRGRARSSNRSDNATRRRQSWRRLPLSCKATIR